MLHEKQLFYVGVLRMNSEVAQPEERRCSVVWRYDSEYFGIFCLVLTDARCVDTLLAVKIYSSCPWTMPVCDLSSQEVERFLFLSV